MLGALQDALREPGACRCIGNAKAEPVLPYGDAGMTQPAQGHCHLPSALQGGEQL